MADIRVMTDHDIPFAIGLTDGEHWGNVPADFARLLSFEPQGCFIAEENRHPVGMICTTCQGASYAFISSLIVSPEARGRKLGEALMAYGLAYLKSRSVETIELDGVFPALSMYRRFGFRDRYLSLRFRRPSSHGAKTRANKPSCTLQELIEFDHKITGRERSHIIKRYYEEFSGNLFIVPDDYLRGYAFARPIADNRMAIGPVVAVDAPAGRQIIKSIISVCRGSTLTIGIPEINRTAVDILLDAGFVYCQPSVRMILGPLPCFNDIAVFAILSADKG